MRWIGCCGGRARWSACPYAAPTTDANRSTLSGGRCQRNGVPPSAGHSPHWRGQHYTAINGAGAALAALGPLPLEEAVAIRDGEDVPRQWDDDLGDELTFALNSREVTVVEE